MKFLGNAIRALLLSTVAFSTAAGKGQSLSSRDIQSRLDSGRFDKRHLLRNAIPYSSMRHLDQDNDNNNGNQNGNQGYYANGNNNNNGDGDGGQQDFEITGDYRLQFNSCITMKVENYNLMLDNVIATTKAGKLHSIQNYIAFDICTTDGCDDQQTFLVDLQTFLESLLNFVPASRQSYCQACVTFQSYCNPDDNDDQQQDGDDDAAADGDADEDADAAADGDEDADADANGDGNRRKLENKLEGYAVLDCDKCDSYSCYRNSGMIQYNDDDDDNDGNNNNNNNNNDAVYEWIKELAECRATGSYWNNLNVYAGWMCNAQGTGIDIGMFLDQYCTMYHNGLKFGDYTSDGSDYQYIYQSQDIIPAMFQSYIDCGDNQNIGYVDKDTYNNLYYNCANNGQCSNNNNNDDDGNGDAANDACVGLFEGGGFEAIDMDNCYGSNEEVEYEDGNEYAQQQKQQYQYIYQYNSDLYQYDISIDQIQDRRAVCSIVEQKFEDGNGSIENVFGNDGGSGYFDSSSGKKLFDKSRGANGAISPIAVVFLVLFAVGATAFAMTLTKRVIRKRRARKFAKKEQELQNKPPEYSSPEVYSSDSKKTPLIIS